MSDIATDPSVRDAIRRALDEDGALHDVTSLALVDPAAAVRAAILARQDCRVAGGTVARAVFHAVDPGLEVEIGLADGMDAPAGASLLTVRGSPVAVLAAERTALNFMQRMTGIATATRRFVEAVAGTRCKILDTRKTVPGLRLLDKYSVRCGGGVNHRMGLHDQVLIKDNHRRLWGGGDPARLDQAVERARSAFPGIPVEVEVESFDELRSALRARPDWILLDNMPPARMAEAVAICAGRCRLEASGGITLDALPAVAATGVDAVSLGCLTHSVAAADLSLEILEAD